MQLEIQKYLRNGGSIEDLAKIGVYSKEHQKYPHIRTFRYDMIEADFSNPITNECRGIILDTSKDYAVLARSYNKFHNYGEGRAANIDWNNARVFEKLDGSLAMLWWNPYSNKWDVATQGTPDASGEVNGWPITFQELFWRTFESLGYQLPKHEHTTFSFELMCNENRVVVRHEKPRLVLHGIRANVGNYNECYYEDLCETAKQYNWEYVKSYNLSSIDEVIESCKTINPLDQEGYVVCDDSFNRVKVKSPQYLALHSMKDGFGPKRVVEMIRQSESDEWLAYFPEFKELHDQYKMIYDDLVLYLTAAYGAFCFIRVQKDFAIAIKDVPFNGCLFALRNGRAKSIKQYLAETNINSLMDYFEKNVK